MTEKDVEKRLISGVRALGGKAYKFVSPGYAGMPDRVVLLPGGITVFVEVKTDDGRLSRLQHVRLKEIAELGGRIQVVYGKTGVEEFLSWCSSHIHTRRGQ